MKNFELQPGTFLKELLIGKKITMKQLEATSGISHEVLVEIASNQRTITEDLAEKLGAALRTSPEVWLSLERTRSRQKSCSV